MQSYSVICSLLLMVTPVPYASGMLAFTESLMCSTNQRISRLALGVVMAEHFKAQCCFSSVQSLSHVSLFVAPWTVAHQTSLSFTISQSLLKLMSIESVMPYNHLILCCPLLLLPSIFLKASGSFPMNQLFISDGQRTGVSASVVSMNILKSGLLMDI